jgi:hypothetical protein
MGFALNPVRFAFGDLQAYVPPPRLWSIGMFSFFSESLLGSNRKSLPEWSTTSTWIHWKTLDYDGAVPFEAERETRVASVMG